MFDNLYNTHMAGYSTPRRNMREGNCSVCGEKVEATKGYLYGGPPWTVKCEPCSGVVARGAAVVVALDGAAVTFRPSGRLGDKFAAYRKALDGARYLGNDMSRLELRKAAAAIEQLSAGGFAMDLGAGVAEAVAAASRSERKVAGDALASAKANVEAIDAKLRARGKALFPFQRSGTAWLAMRYGALLADQMGLGKEQPVSEPVLTPDGWRAIGELCVGDLVIGLNGRPTQVTGVFPQGEKAVYRVTMTDGATTRCGEEHLWRVQTADERFRGRPGRVFPLSYLVARGLQDKNDNNRWFVPMVCPVEFQHQELPVAPYLVGALVANGRVGTSITLHCQEDQLSEAARCLPAGYEFRKADDGSYRLCVCDGRPGDPNDLARTIRGLGLCSDQTMPQGIKKSHTKRLPAEYLLGDVAQRLEVLQGLCDNDGTVSKDGMTVEYNTASPELAEQVLALVRSLGGSAWMSTRKPTYGYKGEKREGRTDHRIRMAMRDGVCPFRVRRKAERCAPRTKYPPTHAIRSVERAGVEESVCIRVEAGDHLYVTRDFIVTHNTIQALAALPHEASALVVGPAVAKGVWCREAAAWRPDLTASMLSGFGSFRWPRGAGEIVVTNYDSLRAGVSELLPEETRSPADSGTTEALAVQPGDDVLLVQGMPEGLYQVRQAQKKGWKVIVTTDRFESALRSFQNSLLGGGRVAMMGVTGSDRALFHSETGKGELTVGDGWAMHHFVVAMGCWARRAAGLTGTTPGAGFEAIVEGARADADDWRQLGRWNQLSRTEGADRRRVSVPKGVARVRVRYTITGAPQTFGIGYRSKSLSVEPPEGTVLIIDEAHACKNPKAARTQMLRALSEAVQARKGRTWALTATPMLNHPLELWAVLRLAGIAEEAFGSFKNFTRMFGGEQDQWGGWTWGKVSEEVPERLRRVMLRRERKDVLPELPEKMWQPVPVVIDATVRKLCDRAEETIRKAGIDLRGSITAAQASRLAGLAFEEISEARAALATAKIPAMLEIVESYEEQNEPLVVFSAHRAPIDLLGKREGWAVITGDTSAEERTAVENAFQAGQLKGVAATIQAGGVAITLTHSAHALFVDRAWNPGLNDQAEDRICRIGQSRGCVIRMLQAEHAIDARVEGLLDEKREIIEASVGASTVMDAPFELAPAVDEDRLARIAAESRERLAAEEKAAAEAKRVAEERAAMGAKNKEQIAKEAAEKKAREAAEKKAAKALARAKARGWVAEEGDTTRHAPETPAEAWAASALLTLSAMDPDHAQEENGIGFNKGDSFIGHWLGLELPKGLTPGQWKLAVQTCRKYHAQVGHCPGSREAKAQAAEAAASERRA